MAEAKQINSFIRENMREKGNNFEVTKALDEQKLTK